MSQVSRNSCHATYTLTRYFLYFLTSVSASLISDVKTTDQASSSKAATGDLRQVRHSAGEEVTKRLVTALVLSQLDYCNTVLAGLPESTIRRLQRVQNAAARLITDTKPWNHITPVLMRLHWMLIKSQILYKLCLLMHLIHTNQRPAYMAEMVELTATSSLRSDLRSASCLLSPALKPSSVS